MKYLQNAKIKFITAILTAVAISALGYFLRTYQFNFFPPIGDTEDELKAVFNGVNLIQIGVPRSWSWFEEYGDFPTVRIRNDNFRIVEPWFDEPPLFSLIIGSYAINKGMTTLESIDQGALRWPMIKLAALNIFLLFILIYILRNFLEATIGSLIFATDPTMILGSRFPMSENMIVTVMLLSLILLVIFVRKNSWLALILAGIIGSSAFLMKTTGIFVPVSLICLLLATKKFKGAIIVSAFLLIAVIVFLAYGYHYNWDLFVKLTSIYSGRELTSPSNIIQLFSVFRIGEKPMGFDGWLIWGWISAVAFSLFVKPSDKERTALSWLILPVVLGSYLVFFSIMSGHTKGWYRFPFYPFISWAAATFIIEIIKNPRFLLNLFFISIPVFSSYIYGTGTQKWNSEQTKIFQLLFVAIMTPSLLYELFNGKRLKLLVQIILILSLMTAIIFNIRTILLFQDRFWY